MDQAPEPPSRVLGVGTLVLTAAVGLSLGLAIFAGDGSGTRGIVPVGTVAIAALVTALVLVALGRLPAPRLGRSGVALAVTAVVLVAWTGATVAWSVVPDLSWDAFNKAAVFAVFLGLGVVLAAATGVLAARVAATLLALAIGAALVWALLAKAIPALDPEGGRIARLHEPVEYWNALALLADAAIVLGLWLGTQASRTSVRVAGGLLVYAAALALALTLSRVGMVAAVVVVALWLWLTGERVQGGLLLVGAAGPAALVGAWAYTRPALVEGNATHAERAADGAVFGVLALAGAGVVATLVLGALRRGLDEEARARAASVLRTAAIVVAAGVVVVLAVGIGSAVASGRTCAEVANDPSRLGSLDPNRRWCWWKEAWQIYSEHAPEGAGAGSFEIARKRHRLDARAVRQPHSVPLQQLADGGFVGFGLFLGVLFAGGAVCTCALRRLGGDERAAGVALVALPTAYLVHALVDYDWDFLATTGPALFALGVLAVAGRSAGEARTRLGLAAGGVVLGLALVVSFAAPRLAERDVRSSTRALVAGDLERASDLATRARRWNPFSIGPLHALARVEERRGRQELAERRYVQAVELQPRNPEAWYALGLYEFQVLERMCAAYRFLNEAYTLDPVGAQWVSGGELDQARDAVDAGACG